MRNRQLTPLWEESLLVSPLHREIARFFNDVSSAATDSVSAMVPRTDAEETDSHYLLSFDLPGVDKDNIDIECNNNQLVVSATRAEDKQTKDGKMHISERYVGEFKRTLKLPESIDIDKMEACYHNGVLRISVPKAESVRPRRIEIKEGKNSIFDRLLNRKEKDSSGERLQAKAV